MTDGTSRVRENMFGNILKASLEMVPVQEANEAMCASPVGFYVCSVYGACVPERTRQSFLKVFPGEMCSE